METAAPGVWGIAAEEDRQALESLLLPVEWSCVTFTSHLRSRDYESIYVHRSGAQVTQAVMLASHALVLPVLDPGAPGFPRELLRRLPSSLTVMGTEQSVAAAEHALARGVTRSVDYHLMKLDRRDAGAPALDERAGSPSLHIRRATPGDLRRLYPLQRDYEKEEVLLDPALHLPRICRAHLRQALHEQLIYLAEEGGVVLAKAGTNARGLGYDQIGGVFTVPSHRNRGLGRLVMQVLLRHVFAEKEGASLFVKRTNQAAIALYLRLGFTPAGGFRISYYIG